MKGINLLVCKGPHYKQKKLSFFLSGLVGLIFLLAVLLNFFLAYKIKQLNLHKNRLNDQLSLLSLSIENLKKEQQQFTQFRMSGINNKNIQFVDKNALKKYSITQFKMVGFFRGGFIEKKWALLKLPNKHFYKVEVNDELGLEQGHVIFIDEKRIIVNGMDNKKIELNINN